MCYMWYVRCYGHSHRHFTLLLHDYSLTFDLENLFSNVYLRDEYLYQVSFKSLQLHLVQRYPVTRNRC